MAALAYLHHDTSNTITYDPPEEKDEPPQQWFWEVKFIINMSNMPSLLEGEVYH
jgi:hypothetical protein